MSKKSRLVCLDIFDTILYGKIKLFNFFITAHLWVSKFLDSTCTLQNFCFLVGISTEDSWQNQSCLPCWACCHARAEHSKAKLFPLPVGLSSRPFCLLSRPFITWNYKTSRRMTKPAKWPVCPAKTQISLGICPVWSESSLALNG